MPEIAARFAGLFEPHDVAAMIAVLDELCSEAAARNWLDNLPGDSIRPVIANILLEIQKDEPLPKDVMKARAVHAIETVRL